LTALGRHFRDLKAAAMNRNILYLVIGALVVVIVVIGYSFYQERQKTTGIEINVGKSGISIEKK
jgi:RsiW-degrading membrane proteinase PrsW (M82 family)